MTQSGAVRVDVSKSPRTYDVVITGDFNGKGNAYHGIYEVDGDTLRMCVNTNHVLGKIVLRIR